MNILVEAYFTKYFLFTYFYSKCHILFTQFAIYKYNNNKIMLTRYP